MQWPMQRADPSRATGVKIIARGSHRAHRIRRTVLFVIGVQNEQHFHRSDQAGVRGVVAFGSFEQHLQEVVAVAVAVIRVHVRTGFALAVGERGQRGHLGDQAGDVQSAGLRVVEVAGIGVEGEKRRHRRHHDCHRMRVMGKARQHGLQLVGQHPVTSDQGFPLGQLCCSRQLAVQQQVGHFEIAGMLGQLGDRVTPVLQDASVTVDVSDR